MSEKNVNFDVCVDVDRFKNPIRYYVYKIYHSNEIKLWVTKNMKLNRYKTHIDYVYSWKEANILVNKIFAGEIKE